MLHAGWLASPASTSNGSGATRRDGQSAINGRSLSPRPRDERPQSNFRCPPFADIQGVRLREGWLCLRRGAATVAVAWGAQDGVNFDIGHGDRLAITSLRPA